MRDFCGRLFARLLDFLTEKKRPMKQTEFLKILSVCARKHV